MSSLERDFFKTKLAKLPAMPPELILDEADEDEEYDDQQQGQQQFQYANGDGDSIDDLNAHSPTFDDSSSASSASSTSTIRAPATFARPETVKAKKRDLEPIPWNHFFSQSLLLTSTSHPSSVIHAYYTPPTSNGPLFVTHHGAGSSGLSFAPLASEIRKIHPDAGIFSIDARGHGESLSESDGDLSLETLGNDLSDALERARVQLNWEKTPDIVLVGHSLGGAVVADVAVRRLLGKNLLAYAVLDVVEGSAMDALQSMQTYLMTRPNGFASLGQAIEWHVRSRTIRNRSSARVSVPALIQNTTTPPTPDTPPSTILPNPRPWRWRTDLTATQPFWKDWFVGLSKKFLSATGGKLLILAGTDRLDRELIIGQMQGKYQLLVLPEVGHFVHEDAPEKTAAALVEFYKRNDRSALVLPKKVGQL